MENEKWKLVLRRETPCERTRAGKILKPSTVVGGYHEYFLRKLGERCRGRAHQLVLQAFVGPKPEGMEINHKNGIRTDNRLENLEYVTHQQNVRHCIDVLGFNRGALHGLSKLTDDQIREIRALRKTGLALARIATRFGITASNVFYIAKGKTWSHVKD